MNGGELMGVKAYDNQLITGVSASGTTDQSGAWSSGVQLSLQLTAYPSGATGALIATRNNSTSPRWAGIRTTGKTNEEFLSDLPGRQETRFDFVPFQPGQSSIDLYAENAADIEFRVIALCDPTWVFFDRDAGLPVVASTSNSWASRTLSACPADSAAITQGELWRPSGESGGLVNRPSGQQLVKLDASQAADFKSNVDTPIRGYCTDPLLWNGWLAVTETYTADSTWRAASLSYSGKALLYLVVDKSGSSYGYDFRMRDSAYQPSLSGNSSLEIFYTGLNTAGEWDYGVESGVPSPVPPLYAMAAIGPFIPNSSPIVVHGSPGHLATITVTGDGTYDFGTRADNPEWWQVGTYALNKSGAVSLLEATVPDNTQLAYGVNETTFRSVPYTYANVGDHIGLRSKFAYESRHQTGSAYIGAFSEVNSPAVKNARTTGKYFCSFKVQHMGTVRNMRIQSFTNRTGTFITSDVDTYAYGEPVTITSSAGKVRHGYVLMFNHDDTKVTFTVEDGSWTSADKTNAVIVGDISGASLTLDGSTYASISGTKMFRSNTNNHEALTGSQVEVGYVTTYQGQHITSIEAAGGPLADERPYAHAQSGNEWQTWAFIVDYSTTQLKVKSIKNDAFYEYTHTNPDGVDLSNVLQQITMIFLGLNWAGVPDRTIVGRIKDFCLDYEGPRAYISNSPVAGEGTKVNYCRPSANYSSNSAELMVDLGEIESDENRYLYLMNDNFERLNEEGVLLDIV